MFAFQEQVIKFANYLLSRKHAQSIKDAGALLFALDKLGNNPVSVFVNLYLDKFYCQVCMFAPAFTICFCALLLRCSHEMCYV